MFDRPKSIAPEPYFTASLELLYHVAVYVRSITGRPEHVTPAQVEEINRLMDAIHNIPSSLVSHAAWCTEERVQYDLRRVDELYEGRTEFRWTREFQKYLSAARRRDADQAR